jgi:long-chain acyl-CoA synthetase
MSHIFGFGEACLGNTLGFTTYMCDPRVVMEKLTEVRPSVFMSVPSVWEKLAMAAMAESDVERRRAKLAEVTGGRFRFCLSGGAGLKREVKECFHDCGTLIIEGYGLTECSPTLTMNRPDAFRFDTVGKPIPSVELQLAEDGEILARGPSIFSGYHKDPTATKEAFTDDGWFKTGDVAVASPDGYFVIADRTKDLIKSGGEWISSVDMEDQVMRIDKVVEAAVIAVPDPKWQERPLVCVVLKPGAELTVDDVRDHLLAGGFAKWQLPERIEVIDAVPRTTVGKFDKKLLRAQFG